MKKTWFLISFVFILSFTSAFSQEEGGEKFSAGADIYSSYIFRGTRYGTGPAFHPTVKFSTGILTCGGWGAFDFHGYQEADLYISLEPVKWLRVGLTDYYFPDFDYFNVSQDSGSHGLEINTAFKAGDFEFSANYIPNKAGGAGTTGNDLYFQASFSKRVITAFIGAGNGWHTEEKKFNLCNIGFSAVKKIKITESFSIPLTGSLIWNPDRGKFYVVAGISL